MSQLGQRVWLALISKKVAVYLIITLTIATTVGNLVPQESYLTADEVNNWLAAWPTIAPLIRLLGLQHFYNTWWYQVIALLFGVNTLACTIEQFRIQGKRYGCEHWPAERILQLNNAWEMRVPGDPQQVLAKVAAVLEGERFSLFLDKNSLQARKNIWGSWGLPLFHVSLLIILMWAVISLGFSSKGVVEITEGQTIQENHQAYRYLEEGRFFQEAHGNFSITLEKMEVKYKADGPPEDANATLLFKTAQDSQEQVLNKSQEGRFKGFNLYLSKLGYAPLLIIKDTSGKWITGNFYNVAPSKDESGELYREEINFPETGMVVKLRFYPNLTGKDNPQQQNAYTPLNPGIDIEVLVPAKEKLNDQEKATSGDSTQGNYQVDYQGTVRLGETVKLSNYQLEFPELRRYGEFIIARNFGVTVIFAGFWLAVISLLIFYLFLPKEVWVKVENVGQGTCRLVCGGRANRFKNLFAAEFREYQENIASLLLKDDD